MQSWYKTAWGLISHPYTFFEAAIAKGNPVPATLTFIIILALTNFGWWLVGAVRNSYVDFIFNLILSILAYPLAVIIIYLVCHLFIRENGLHSFFVVWGFSYLPTFCLFLFNVITHGLGNFAWFARIPSHPLFILGFWTFAFLMFLWKVLLLAITLRLAGNLNLRQIVPAFIILMLIVGMYWGLTFSLEWLKLPFI